MTAPSRTTGRPRDPEIDTAVLAATRELLVEVGYQRLTFGLVAERAGSSRPALYRRWPSKAHLVYDAVFPSEPDDPIPAEASFRDQLLATIRRILGSYSRAEAREATPFLLAEVRDLDRRSSIVDGLLRQAREEFTARVAEAIDRNEVRADADAAMLLDTVHAAAMHHAIGHERPDPDFAARLVSLVLSDATDRGPHAASSPTAKEPSVHDRRATMPDGTRLVYRTGGTGSPALVFVHGWCSNLDHWDAQLRHFARDHRVLAFDRRGHGRSDVARGRPTPAQHAADLAAIVRKERLRHIVIVAHAGGGPTALAFAVRHPDLVRALVLVDTHVSPYTKLGRPHTAQRSALGRLVDQLTGPDGTANFDAMYRGFFSEHAGAVGESAVRAALQVPLRVARAELASLAVDTEGMARRLAQPVLWLTVAAADEPRLRSIFRDVWFGRVVGSGHFPHLEVPEQVNAMIDRFLSTLPRPA